MGIMRRQRRCFLFLHIYTKKTAPKGAAFVPATSLVRLPVFLVDTLAKRVPVLARLEDCNRTVVANCIVGTILVSRLAGISKKRGMGSRHFRVSVWYEKVP